MKAFWWFKKNSIAGMARPGFNAIQWFDLPFDEAVLLGWLGQHSSGSESLDSFKNHLRIYAPKIFSFYELNEETGARALEMFANNAELLNVANKLAERTQIFESVKIEDNRLHLTISPARLKKEIEFLRTQGVVRLISLTEKHHNKEFLQDHFNTHHLAIQDLGPPKIEQAVELAEVIKTARQKSEVLAVHCLAGIGRTSTMLMASHILMGENAHDLELLLKKQNPQFMLSDSQRDFLRSLKTARPRTL